MAQDGPSLPPGFLQLSIPTRDPVYYIPDGNTVLLVDRTLFRVHRSTLTKDKSVFESMFSLSKDADGSDAPSEGDSDDNPIRLQGDTPDELRALLWALYALPHELMVAMTPQANSVQLYELARIAHKYQFRSLESWALVAIHAYYTRPGVLETLPPDTEGMNLVSITELAALCERMDLLETTVARWKRQIGEGKNIALAIGVAERLNLRTLLGLAYHAMLIKGRDAWDADPQLTRDQRIRLLSGHYALGRLWEELPAQPPTFTHSARCTAQQRCGKAWAALWRSVLELGAQVMALPYADVLGKVMLAESTLRALVEREIPSQPLDLPFCKDGVLLATSLKLRDLRENLADYFTDVS